MRNSRQRAAWVVVLGAGAVLGYAGIQWREIALRWRVAELERQGVAADLPEDFVAAEPGTIAGEALARYVRTPAGKDRLLRSYLGFVESSRGDMSVGSGGKTAVLLVWMGLPRDYAMVAFVSEPASLGPELPRKPRPIQVASEDLKLWWSTDHDPFGSRLQDLVLEIGYEEHPVPGRPGARFSVVSNTEAERPCSRSFTWNYAASDYACLIESDPYRLAPPGDARR